MTEAKKTTRLTCFGRFLSNKCHFVNLEWTDFQMALTLTLPSQPGRICASQRMHCLETLRDEET